MSVSQRSSFAVEGTAISGGLSALLYHQQEKRQSGYSGDAKPIKKNSRLMLAVVTRKSPQAKPHIAVLDFGLSREGKTALVPDTLKLPLLGKDDATGSINEALDRRSGLEVEIGRLNQRIGDLKERIETLLAASNDWDGTVRSLDEKIRNKEDFVARERSIQDAKQSALNTLSQIANYKLWASMGTFTLDIQPSDDASTYYRRLTVEAIGGAWAYASAAADQGLVITCSSGRETYSACGRGFYYNIIGMYNWINSSFIFDMRLSSDAAQQFTTAKRALDQAVLDLNKIPVVRNELVALYQDRAEVQRAKDAFPITLQNYRNELAERQQELTQKEAERASLRNSQLGEVRVPMQLLHTDRFGLTVCGGLLNFAYTNDSPTLFESATGKLGLYFRGASDNQFFAAYFDTLTERVVHTLPASSGQLILEARTTETELDATSLSIGPGSQDDTCTLTISNAATQLSETWPDLPRQVHAFTQILNGNGLPPLSPPVQASEPAMATQTTAPVPLDETERQTQLDALAASYAGNTAVQSQVTALKAMKPSDPKYQAATETLSQTLQELATQASADEAVFTEEENPSLQQLAYYDYSQVSLSQPDKRIDQGSLFFNVHLGDAQGDVQDTAEPIQLGAVNTRVSEWMADSQGNALYLNGQTTLVKPQANLPLEQFDLPSDLSLETWVRPDSIDANQQVVLINHNAARSQYYLGLQGVTPGKSLTFNGRNTCIETGLHDLSGSALTIEYWFRGKRLSSAVSQQAGEQRLLSGWTKPAETPRPIGSMVFNGTDQYVEVPFDVALNPDKFTVSMWVNLTGGHGTYRSPLCSRSYYFSQCGGYLFYILGDGKCAVFIGHGSGWTAAMTAAPSINMNTWTHLAGSYDGTTLKLYINGQEVASALQSSAILNSGRPLRLAAGNTESSDATYHFPGLISEVSIWNRASTADEIQANMNRSLSGKEEGLVAYYPLSDNRKVGVVPQALDLANGRHGQVVNSAALKSEAPFQPKPAAPVTEVSHQLTTEGHPTNSVPIKGNLTDGRWHHVAMTWQQGQAQGFASYLDGELVSRGPAGDQPLPRLDAPVVLGASSGQAPFLEGSIAEVRIWSVARSQSQIRSAMRKRIRNAMPGLLASWSLMDEDLKDYSGNGHHGTLRGDATTNLSYPLQAAYAVAAVGRERVQSEQFAYLEGWLHVASAFNQSYALQFDGIDDYLNAGQAGDLNLTQELTIEAFLLMETGSERGVLTKGRLDDGGDQDVPYSLTIAPDGRLVFAFERSDHQKEICTSNDSIPSGQFCKIAVVRSQGMDRKEIKKKKVVEGQEMEFTESVDVKQWQMVTFFINGRYSGHQCYEEIKPGTSDQPLEIGKTYRSGGSVAFFKGILSEVRLWSRALPSAELGAAIKGQEQGLAAWWRFEENAGNTAFDSKGSNHCERNGARWVKNPDPRGSTFVLYLNGVSQKTQPLDFIAQGDQGFSLGGTTHQGMPQCLLKGSLEETRIWRSSRTEEQIQDNLFRRLLGERKELHAYYQYDADVENRLSDCSGRGHHLTVIDPDWQISNAPVSYETPQVRSALAGVTTDYHGKIESSPAVQEYGDMQYNDERELIGVMKRCYSFIKAGEWQLITGFKIGNVITEWVGQAQYDPQIIGFIEGAPPVPSENCTELADSEYSGGSTVEIVEADNVQYSLGASHESTLDAAFRLAASVGGGLETMLVTAPAGGGSAQEIAEVNFEASLEGNIDISNAWSSESSVSSGKNTSKQTRVTAMGSWESDTNILNPEIGKRFVFNNVGFALVQSDTADIYALRMEHNQALIAFRFQPNPDIPKDWNLVPFQMNPRYVRQGTLDGRVGMTERGNVYDPSYPNARDYGEYSYFKPREAYLLKNQIRQAEMDLKTYYDNFSTSPLDADRAGKGAGIGAATGAAIGAVAGPLGMAIGAAGGAVAGSLIGGLTGDKRLPQKLSKRNLVNTYVWTADGGFFAETTELSEAMSETVGGSFSLSGAVSFNMSLSAEIGPVSTGFEMEASIGGSLNLTKTKTRDSEQSFSLSVDLSVPNNLQKFTEGNPVYDPEGNPVLQPGKVDAYRFMTFYLEPSVQNFDMFVNKVIDPIWLQQSRHPNAAALRATLKSQQKANKDTQKSAPWRVLHRVTFVSRVLPEIEPGKAPQSPEQLLKAAEIDSNYELIKRLEPFVSDKVDDYVQFTDAVRETIDAYLPELKPAKDYIVEYMCQYFQVYDGMI